jgi:hypothetical protein
VQPVYGGLVDSWCLHCRVVAVVVDVVGSIDCVVAMVDGYEGCY